jgi:hypothetical protein
MKPDLSTYQRRFAQHRMTFGTDLLSPELGEALRRASLARAENQKKETGIIDFVCGLYLHDRDEIAPYLNGDFSAVVSQNFPIHRFGNEGLVPKTMLDQMTSDTESCSPGFGFSLNYSDELHRLLWVSAKLANAVGKKASVKDAVAALMLDQDCVEQLAKAGITPSRVVADFDKDVRTIIFHATPHTGGGWPTEVDFDHDGSLQPPLTLEVSTPSGPFQPVRSARVKLNGSEIASVSWPEKPTSNVAVVLLSSNKIEFELNGPAFGSLEVAVRGTPTSQHNPQTPMSFDDNSGKP